MTGANPLVALATHFSLMSLLAFGGVNAVIPEMHRNAVEIMGWMTDEEFARFFALAQVAPGPNMLVSTLIGWHVGGVAGAIVATAAICAPPLLLTFSAFRLLDRYRNQNWLIAVQQGLAWVVVGLLAAGAFLITAAATAGGMSFAIVAGTSLLAYATRINPLWALGAGAALGFAGLV